MELVDKVVDEVTKGKKDKAVKSAKKLLETKFDPKEALDKLTKGMQKVGEKFENLEIFLPEMMMSADAMLGVKKVLEPKFKEIADESTSGTVVIGTAEGDEHTIGKDIVITMLKASGVNIHDLGTDVGPLQFIKQADEFAADFIGISALMTTTMPTQQEVIEMLKEKGIRENYKIIVGGSPVTAEWAKEIGADGYASNAAEAVTLVQNLSKGGR